MSVILPGKRVMTKELGPATVIRLSGAKAFVALEDLDGLQIELPVDDLIFPDGNDFKTETEKEKVIVKKATVKKPPDEKDLAKRRAVEALRFGLVPEDYIEELTLGFHQLKRWVWGRLPGACDGRPQVSEIAGPFGAGKSHTMSVIRYVAGGKGFVTARVEIDGKNISLSEPEKLLFNIWITISAPDLKSSTPLLDLYLKALEAGHPPPSIAPGGIDRVQDNYRLIQTVKKAGRLDQFGYAIDAIISSSDEFTARKVAEEVCREPNINPFDVKVRRMIGLRVEDRPCDFIESLAGHAIIARLAGYQGLVVTIDEFEIEHLLTWNKFERVKNLINTLIAYFSGNMDHPTAPMALFIATVGQDGHTGDAIIDNMVKSTGGKMYQLKPWPQAERVKLAQKIHHLYCDAYKISQSFDHLIVEQIEKELKRYGYGDSGLIRAFIKRYVGTLDSLYGPPAM